jgi:23S rRNA (guanosine2251-2'-O)-methyltransferase
MGASKRRGRSRSEELDSRLVVGGPHAVEAALARASPIDRVFLCATAGRRAQALADEARGRGVPVSSIGEAECDRLTGTNSQGIAAAVRFAYLDHGELIEGLAPGGLIVYLDGITDPHNLGAILRTAAAAGVAGVVVPGRRCATVTATVVRVSAGAALSVPVVRAGNLVQALSEAERAGLWLTGLAHRAERVLAPGSTTGRQGLVVGGEGEGLHRLVAATCHELARLPMIAGSVESLNASVAAALAIYRLREQALYGGARAG